MSSNNNNYYNKDDEDTLVLAPEFRQFIDDIARERKIPISEAIGIALPEWIIKNGCKKCKSHNLEFKDNPENEEYPPLVICKECGFVDE
jgi:hypothetical protein